MKKIISVAIFALGGTLAFGHIGGSLETTAQILPQPGTIALFSIGGVLMTLLRSRQIQ